MPSRPLFTPLCSRFNEVKVRELISYHADLIGRGNIDILEPIRSIDDIDAKASYIESSNVILALACTGGVSRLIIKLSEFNKPMIIISHPKQNSLASALHSAIILNKKDKIFTLHHNLSKDNVNELRKKIKVAEAISELINNKILLIVPSKNWLIQEHYDLGNLERKLNLELVLMELKEFYDLYERTKPHSGLLAKYINAAKFEVSDNDIKESSKVFSAIRSILEKTKAIAYGIRCFPFILKTGVTPCLAISHSIDLGIVGSCEADLGALVTMLLAKNITGQPVFMGNIEDLDGNDLVLAHCTISTKLADTYELVRHFETGESVSVRGSLKRGGEVTIIRLSNDFNKIYIDTGKIVKGEAWSDEFCRTQLEIRLSHDASILLEEPIASHLVLVKGKWNKEFEILSRYLKLIMI